MRINFNKLSDDDFSKACAEKENFYLQKILAYSLGKHTEDFRTLIDSWYAYYQGKGFIKRTGTVQWFNRKDLAHPRHREAIKRMHFHSEDAWEILHNQRPRQDLIKDHAVPVAVLKLELIRRKPTSIADVKAFLFERYRLGVITSAEDHKLRKAKLIKEMPPGDTSEFARYKHVAIRRYHSATS